MSTSRCLSLLACAVGGGLMPPWLLSVPVSAAPPDASTLAASIDAHLARSWSQAGVKPAAPADDATFLRRVSLDLIGRIPTVAEVRALRNDSEADRRARVVERLLKSRACAEHFATFWRRARMPQMDAPRFAALADDCDDWLAARLRENAPYDRVVHELLAVRLAARNAAARARNAWPVNSSFLEVGEFKLESLAANTARAFLGINLDCAQCHNHLFARWTREEFWQTAAFFAPPAPAAKADRPRLELAIADTDQKVTATFLTGGEIQWPQRMDANAGRDLLADWVTAKDNPYFARSAVNRLWAHCFGAGLVEPLDDLSGEIPPSHPEILAQLTAAFVDSGFDVRYVTEVLVLTRAYQLSCGPASGDAPQESARLFASMPIRGPSDEQLHDSLRVAARMPPDPRT